MKPDTSIQETFSLQEYQLQLVATLDYNRILVQDIVQGGLEVWQAEMDGNLLVDGIRYHLLTDLEEATIYA